ncbi:ABC transporter ATP-binding protein [Microbacterium gorillae]|uniref:ABC transporter ATP-binding protein n=1 Tax=Microbacterium gorillae TaxID=1231063 RepID=UPI000694DD37|nr:ABC transporter ATP-binding protein [Microbacterium gorillae]
MTTITLDAPAAAAPTSAPVGRMRLEGVSKRYPGKAATAPAVDDVTLDIAPGEFISLLGPSGCGKTTTLRMIAGFETPTAGRITLDGEDLLALPPHRRPMSMVFQSYALFPHLSVRDNIAYGLKLRKLPRAQIDAEVDAVVDVMGLDGLDRRAPHQLSGGQQQRVALARALVIKPKVLLFDEPLSNLDAKLRGTMRLQIRRLQQQLGITSIFVTHDQEEAMTMSDRIVVMRGGRVQQIGSPQEIYRRPTTPFVADFIGTANILAARVTRVGDGRADVVVAGRALSVPAHPDIAVGSPAGLLVRPEAARITPVDACTPGGEDIGEVIVASFAGERIDYELHTESGTLQVADVTPGPDALAPGDRARIEIDASRTWLLPGEAR